MKATGAKTPLSSAGVPFGTPPGPPFGTVQMNQDLDSLASVRGRLGYVWGGALFYGAGGVAWARRSFTGSTLFPLTVTCNPGLATCGSATSASTTSRGQVWGGGIEFSNLSPLLLRFEYLSYTFNSGTSSTSSASAVFHPANVYTFGSARVQVLQAGASVKF